MTKIPSAIMCSLILAAPAGADDIEPVLGNWISPDGLVRQQIARVFDGTFIETKMWFQSESGWKLVSMGAAYRRPGESIWRGIARTRDMDGIELFESIVETRADSKHYVANIAYMADGTTIQTEEEWVFTDKDHYSYTIFRFEDGRRVPWMKGEWTRLKDDR